MTDLSAKTRACPNLEEIFRSDLLPQLVALIEALPALEALLPQLFQMRLVVDANRVQAELRWRLRRRRNPANRSALHEAIDAGVVILFAPPYVTHEIGEHAAEIAQDTGTSVSEVNEEWERFQKHLRFHIPRSRPSPTEAYADIDDFPYLATWRELDAQAIYTTDRHLAQMEAPVISVLIDTYLRDYARASTVQIALGIGSSFSVLIGWEFIQVLYRALASFLRSIQRLPPVVQISLAAGCFAFMAHPKSRARLQHILASFEHSETVLALQAAIVDLGIQFVEAGIKTQGNYERLKSVIPQQRKRPLLMHARSVCTAARAPLTLEELERRIRRGGYVSRSKTSRRYLVRILRSDNTFAEVSPGRWVVRVH
jgi:hypothetical protein